jgi:hypothetical protein
MNDNTVLRIKVPAHLYESVKEQLTLTEAKKGKHNLGAGMEIVKEKKMKTPKDGMHKMQEEKHEVEEGLMDTINAALDKIFYNPAVVDAPKEVVKACIEQANQEKKSNPKADRGELIVNCLRTKGAGFAKSGSERGMSAMGGAWNKNEAATEKKGRTLDELKKAKDMLEMKIKKMEEASLQEKKKEEEEEA